MADRFAVWLMREYGSRPGCSSQLVETIMIRAGATSPNQVWCKPVG